MFQSVSLTLPLFLFLSPYLLEAREMSVMRRTCQFCSVLLNNPSQTRAIIGTLISIIEYANPSERIIYRNLCVSDYRRRMNVYRRAGSAWERD